MAEVPTTEDFLTKFPEFEDQEEELIEAAIAEAQLHVGQNWDEASYAIAIMLLAAHYVQTSGGAYDSGGLASFSIGAIRVSYATEEGVAELKKTSYGQRFLELQHLNCRGALVI